MTANQWIKQLEEEANEMAYFYKTQMVNATTDEMCYRMNADEGYAKVVNYLTTLLSKEKE